MGVLQLLGPDQTTVLFDFADPTGAANPNTLVTRLGAGLDFGNVDPALALQDAMYGARLLERRHPPVEVTIPLIASATTDDNLWSGVGQLARFLTSADRDHPLYLKWTELSSTYYYDVIGAVQLPQIIRGATVGALAAARKSTMGPIPVVLLRQPWRRGTQVTTSADTVEGDPSAGTPDQSRIASLTVAGDLPTPGQVKVVMDSGSAVAAVSIGHRARGSKAADVFTDYLTDTGWFDASSSIRGWTNTLGTDTTSTGDGGAVAASTASVNAAGSSAGTMLRRVRVTRTTLMDSLRGGWIPYVRCKTTAAAVWDMQMYWGPSTADPAPFAGRVVRLDMSGASSFGFTELPLGNLRFPESGTLGGVAIEIHAQLISGSGNLLLDIGDLWPETIGTAIQEPGGMVKIRGDQLTSPADQITGDPAWAAGTDGFNFVQLSSGESAGWGPNTGTDMADGRHRATFDFEIKETAGTVDVAELRIANVTDNTEAASLALGALASGRYTRELLYDAAATKFYQPQVTYTTSTGTAFINVYSISDAFLASIGSGEGIRTDPTRYAVDRLDSSGNISGYLGIQGTLPVMLEPGENHLKVRADDIPFVGTNHYEHKLDRDPVVTVTYDDRYAV